MFPFNPEIPKRRENLAFIDNPRVPYQYMISHTQKLNSQTELRIAYIPDKKLLNLPSCEAYFNHLADLTSPQILTNLLDDLQNELLPRWLMVKIKETKENKSVDEITAIDFQREWKDFTLAETLLKTCNWE